MVACGSHEYGSSEWSLGAIWRRCYSASCIPAPEAKFVRESRRGNLRQYLARVASPCSCLARACCRCGFRGARATEQRLHGGGLYAKAARPILRTGRARFSYLKLYQQHVVLRPLLRAPHMFDLASVVVAQLVEPQAVRLGVDQRRELALSIAYCAASSRHSNTEFCTRWP